MPGQGLGVRVDQPRPAVEPLAMIGVVRTIGLDVIQLPGADAGDQNAPDVSPSIVSRDRRESLRPARGRRPGCTAATAWPVAERLNTTNCTPVSCKIGRKAGDERNCSAGCGCNIAMQVRLAGTRGSFVNHEAPPHANHTTRSGDRPINPPRFNCI